MKRRLLWIAAFVALSVSMLGAWHEANAWQNRAKLRPPSRPAPTVLVPVYTPVQYALVPVQSLQNRSHTHRLKRSPFPTSGPFVWNEKVQRITPDTPSNANDYCPDAPGAEKMVTGYLVDITNDPYGVVVASQCVDDTAMPGYAQFTFNAVSGHSYGVRTCNKLLGSDSYAISSPGGGAVWTGADDESVDPSNLPPGPVHP